MGPDATIEVGWDNSAARAGAEEFKRHASSASEHATNTLGKAGNGLQSIFSSIAAPLLGLASVNGLAALAEEFGAVNDMALRLNESTDVVQRVGASAKDASSDIETVASAMEKMQKAMADGGTEDAQKALKELGISARDFAGMNLEEKMVAVGKGLAEMRGEGEDTSGIYALMGKGAGKLIPTLIEVGEAGKAGFAGMTVVGKENIQMWDRIGDNAEHMMQRVKVGLAGLGDDLINVSDYMKIGFNTDEAGALLDEKVKQADPKKDDGEAAKLKAQKLAEFDRDQARAAQEKFNEYQKKETAEIGNLEEKLADKKAKLVNDSLSGVEKETAARQRLIKIDADIAGMAGPGAEADTLKLEIERVEVLGEINNLSEKNLKTAEEKVAKDEKESKVLAEKLDKEEKIAMKRRGAFAELAKETSILELQAGGRHKKAEAAQKELDIAMRAKQLKESLGMNDDDALKQAKHESDLKDKIDNPHKIRGHKDTRDHTSAFRSLNEMASPSRHSAWENLQTSESAFQRMQRGPSPLDAMNKRNNQPAKPSAASNPNAKLEDTLASILGFMQQVASE